MKVVWTNNATGQLRAIHDYIARDSPRYAIAMVDRITRRSKQIAHYPLSRSIVAEYDRDDIREVIELPYRILYRVRSERIDVLAVIHSARQLPSDVE